MQDEVWAESVRERDREKGMGYGAKLSKLVSPSSRRIYFVDIWQMSRLPWIEGVSKKVVIPDVFFYAVVDPSLWPDVQKIMKNYPTSLKVILEDEDVPEGIKEQLSGNLNYKKRENYSPSVLSFPEDSLRSPLDSFHSFPEDSLRSPSGVPVPEELIVEIIVRNNPYDLKDLSKVSKQFEDVLSKKDTLDKISLNWNLPKASSISNLADVWKVSNVTDEYEKHFFPEEVLLHYLKEKNEDKFVEAWENVEGVSELMFIDLIALAIIFGLRDLYFFLLEEYEIEYAPHRLFTVVLGLLIREEYYDEEFLKKLLQATKSKVSLRKILEYKIFVYVLADNKKFISERIMNVLKEIDAEEFSMVGGYQKEKWNLKESEIERQKREQELIGRHSSGLIRSMIGMKWK